MEEMWATLCSNPFWFGLGFLAQAVFTCRFLVQWLASERAGKSVVPVAFWLLSITGAAMLFAYAVWRRDPVIILGQCIGIFVYSRNLVLIKREKETKKLLGGMP